MASSLVIREVKNSRDSEEPISAMEQVFATLGTQSHTSPWSILFGKKDNRFFSFEMASINQSLKFFIVLPSTSIGFLENQLISQYPKIMVTPVQDILPSVLALPHAAAQLVLTNPFYVPLKSYKDVKDLDLLSGVCGQLSALPKGYGAYVQLRIEPAGSSWQQSARAVVSRGIPDPSVPGKFKSHPQARIIEEKISQTGFFAAIRVVVSAPTQDEAERALSGIASSYGVFSAGNGNALALSSIPFWQKKKFETVLLTRYSATAPRYQILGSTELASLWHPPGKLLSSIKNIAWGDKLIGEAPEALPIATEKEEEKKEINFFGKTEYKNASHVFGIKREDRRKHVYIVGKTGTGKSTLIANMVINDARNKEGLAIVDPHGDLTDVLLDYMPSFRVNDVCYLDPSDTEYPFHLNPLELKNPAHREIIASGIVSIFYKLYHNSWGPRLEYILRNTILTLLYVPQSTLLQIPELLTNEKYRGKVIEKLPDQVLKNFWINEYNKLSPQMRSESIMPILNKVGQFLSSQTIRNIVGNPTSTVDLEAMMNEGKIILANLSQGKLGEDNSALLGAMIITKLQLAAMNRVYQNEENRRDFYLYVDEFQNFATSSFIKILSEARKYRLDLTLANQYIGQIDEDVQKAIFGNAGSLISFGVGATDARLLSREFGEKYAESELVGLGNYQIVLKLSINNRTSSPFSATTLPLPKSHNKNREKIIRSSRERFTKKIV